MGRGRSRGRGSGRGRGGSEGNKKERGVEQETEEVIENDIVRKRGMGRGKVSEKLTKDTTNKEAAKG